MGWVQWLHQHHPDLLPLNPTDLQGPAGIKLPCLNVCPSFVPQRQDRGWQVCTAHPVNSYPPIPWSFASEVKKVFVLLAKPNSTQDWWHILQGPGRNKSTNRGSQSFSYGLVPKSTMDRRLSSDCILHGGMHLVPRLRMSEKPSVHYPLSPCAAMPCPKML